MNKDKYEDNRGRFDELQLQLSNIQRAYTTKEAKQASLMSFNEDNLTIDVDKVQQEIDEINITISKYYANVKFQSAVDEMTKNGFIVDNSIAFLKAAEKLTGPNGIVVDSMNDPFDRFGDCVNKYIKIFFGSEVKLKFNNSTAANSFGFGLEDKSGIYIPYGSLSSGEQCLFAFSLMLTIVDTACDELKLILIDDIVDHLDDTNASKFFKAVNKIKDIQIVMAGVKPCSEEYAVEVK